MKQYIPLALLFSFALLFAVSHDNRTALEQIDLSMGYFLALLSMLKLFDLAGFYESFKKYDLITQKIALYGYAYPFIEGLLGFLLIFQIAPLYTNSAIFLLMAFTSIGIFRQISSGKGISCACMGSFISVPLATVSLIETGGMALLSLLHIGKEYFPTMLS
ncbi:MAG: hypothetical protein QRY74_03680 [Chlamydia sp.]